MLGLTKFPLKRVLAVLQYVDITLQYSWKTLLTVDPYGGLGDSMMCSILGWEFHAARSTDGWD